MKDGHLNVCKVCRDAYVKQWAIDNPKKRKKIANKYARANRDDNRDEVNRKKREAYAADPVKWRQRRLDWVKKNPAKARQQVIRRQQSVAQAMPEWADESLMNKFYDLAKQRTRDTGFQWHVDHIVPLRGKGVCGLHAHTNLQVITAAENFKKNNKHWPDMPVQ